MNSETDYNQTLDANIEPTRPTFLSVLCILTFVVSGYYLITGIIGLFSDPTVNAAQWSEASASMAEAMEDVDTSTRAMLENFMNSLGTTMRMAMQNAMALAFVQIIGAGLSIFGAYLMFKLKRQGFNVYILSKVVGIIGGLVFLGLNVLTISIYVFVAIIALVFIALYGTQRKYMR